MTAATMRCKMFSIAIVSMLALSAGARSDPVAPPASSSLEVVNESGKVFAFTAADLAKLPQRDMKARDNSGNEVIYAGVEVSAVLKQADVTLGERLRGKLLANHLIIESSDKYRVLFSLPEIDPDWTDNVVLLAVSRNGQPLDAAHGPMQLVVPADKRHSRWVKQVIRLTVRTDSK
jgi:DMSO/TMAO reductase YedYZ molybdopterin-dependent catalytic subunit